MALMEGAADVNKAVKTGFAAAAPVEIFAWDDVQYFLELVRKTTLLKAARRLGVSHTTVLRRIAALERRLDQKLFERTQRGFVLTEVGWRLLPHAEAMERGAEGISRVGDTSKDLSGAVRIAAVEGLAAKVLTPAMPAFQQKYPGICVEILTALQSANLTKRQADLSVGLLRPTGPRLIARRLAHCDVHLYASDEYLAQFGEPRTMLELRDHRFVDYVDDLIELPALKWLRDAVGQQRIAFRSTSPLSQLSAVVAGVGIGMFPAYLTQDCATLRRILPHEIGSKVQFWLAVHEELRNVPRMAAAFDFIKRLVHASNCFTR